MPTAQHCEIACVGPISDLPARPQAKGVPYVGPISDLSTRWQARGLPYTECALLRRDGDTFLMPVLS